MAGAGVESQRLRGAEAWLSTVVIVPAQIRAKGNLNAIREFPAYLLMGVVWMLTHGLHMAHHREHSRHVRRACLSSRR